MKCILIFIVIIIFYTIYILHNNYKSHYWYNVYDKLNKNESKYYSSNSFKNESIIENNIKKINLNELENLYKNYFPSIKIDKQKIINFFNFMQKPVIIYKRSDKIIAAVFNSINQIFFKNKIENINFVDYAIVEKNIRNKNIFQGLMNEVANYTNINNSKFIMFKIDLHPIPSFKDFNFKSWYYTCIKQNISNNKNMIVEKKDISPSYFPKINIFFKNNLKFYPIIEEKSSLANILINNDERITLVIEEKIIINMKYNSNNYLEILYIFCLENNDELLKESLIYIINNIEFKYLYIDAIGYNIKAIDIMSSYFRKKHETYHYILGLKEKLEPKDVYYYF